MVSSIPGVQSALNFFVNEFGIEVCSQINDLCHTFKIFITCLHVTTVMLCYIMLMRLEHIQSNLVITSRKGPSKTCHYKSVTLNNMYSES